MPKIREHSEWFRKVADKKCACGARGVQVFSWGEYVSGKWRTVDRLCERCYDTRVKQRLTDHAKGCGCMFKMNFKGGIRPDWLVIESEAVACS